MKLTNRQLELLREAGIKVPDGAEDDSFMTAEDDIALGDYLLRCLGPGQSMTPKCYEIQDLLNDMAQQP